MNKKDMRALEHIIDILVDTKVLKPNEDGQSYDLVEDKVANDIDEAYNLGFKDGLEHGRISERAKIRAMIDSIDPYEATSPTHYK